jgi:hypothetical protein
MSLQAFINLISVFGSEKLSPVLLKISTEIIGIYLVFLRFSNFLLKLIQ